MTLNVNMHKEFHERPGVVIPALGKLTQENKLEVSMAIQKKNLCQNATWQQAFQKFEHILKAKYYARQETLHKRRNLNV